MTISPRSVALQGFGFGQRHVALQGFVPLSLPLGGGSRTWMRPLLPSKRREEDEAIFFAVIRKH